MSPIRLGIIGLSTDPSAWATTAHLGPLRSAPLSDKYTITALGTSRPETAKAAAKAYGLPENKAYSSAEDIANDPDVDMVVVSVTVEKHKDLAIPALKAKKDVYVEWPLGRNLAEAEELAKLAKTQGVKTVVGIQGRLHPVFQKVRTGMLIRLSFQRTISAALGAFVYWKSTYLRVLRSPSLVTKDWAYPHSQAKQIIDSGELGRIVSTSLVTTSSMLYQLKAKYAMLLDPSSGKISSSSIIRFSWDLRNFAPGASWTTVPVAHVLDPLCYLLGEFKSLSATSAITHPEVTILGDDGQPAKTSKRPTADSVSVSGILDSGAAVSFSANITTPATPDNLSWIISGEKRSLKIEGQNGFVVFAAPTLSQFKPGEGAKWEEVEVPKTNPGGIGELYESFATGKPAGFVDFEGAIKRHQMVDAIIRSSETGQKVTY